MKKLIFFSLAACLFQSCNSNKTNYSTTHTFGDSTGIKSAEDFFPVTSYIKGQMIILDSMPVTVLQITKANNKTDSSWISKDKVKPLLQPFIEDIIDKENLVPFFKESKFNDQSTDAVTFTYDPISNLPDSISIRHWVVYINPEKGTVKRVYIVKQSKQKEQSFTQQLTWQGNKWAKIVTISNNNGQSSIINETKWIWDFTEDQQSN